jgi:nicotinate-nucleotide pyrophosphorylase (carboxylating)
VIAPPPRHAVLELLRRALDEDLGTAGDLTTDATVPADAVTSAAVVARDAGTVAGLAIATQVFELLDDRVVVDVEVADGSRVDAGATLARIHGPTRAVLTGERTALNLLGHLSGIATATRAVVDAVAGTGVMVADTRKTTPGLRALEKYAVRCGGGRNHRSGLHDAVMIKDNHLAATGSIAAAVAAVRAHVGHTVTVEVEVDRIDQLADALDAGADIVLLDNMDAAELRRAVALADGRAVTEASGRITPATARELARTGVDVLSLGWITHSAPILDVALDLPAVG